MSTKLVKELISSYPRDIKKVSIAAIASHSALDVFDGAKDEGFRTIAICQKGREKPYLRFDRVVDVLIILDRFADVLRDDVIAKLKELNAIFVPNRSFSVYVGYDNIENKFPIPIFGNRYLLRYEERTGDKNYYRSVSYTHLTLPTN